MTPEAWQVVIVESIKAVSVVLVAVVTVGLPLLRRLRRVRDDVAAGRHAAEQTREQVQNDHSTNLRDDVDDLAGKVDAVVRTAASNTQAIGAVALEVRKLVDVVERIDRRESRRRWPWR
jgi:HAMP domain-containing protein